MEVRTSDHSAHRALRLTHAAQVLSNDGARAEGALRTHVVRRLSSCQVMIGTFVHICMCFVFLLSPRSYMFCVTKQHADEQWLTPARTDTDRFTYTYTYTSTYTHTCTYIHIHIHVRAQVHLHKHMNLQSHESVHVRMDTWTCTLYIVHYTVYILCYTLYICMYI